MHFKLFGLTENYWDKIHSLLLGLALVGTKPPNPIKEGCGRRRTTMHRTC